MFDNYPAGSSLAPMSVDVFLCKMKAVEQKEEISDNPIILIGTRSGCILEIALYIQFEGLKEVGHGHDPREEKEDEHYNQSQSIKFTFSLISRTSSARKEAGTPVHCAIQHKDALLIFLNSDKTLQICSTDTCR
jgi:hypothetical protein